MYSYWTNRPAGDSGTTALGGDLQPGLSKWFERRLVGRFELGQLRFGEPDVELVVALRQLLEGRDHARRHGERGDVGLQTGRAPLDGLDAGVAQCAQLSPRRFRRSAGARRGS